MARVSVKSVAKAALREDAKIRTKLAAPTKDGSPSLAAATNDSFVNFSMKLGVGADNSMSSSAYGFNPITRLKTQLEWIHRGSWLGGLAVDVVADDMTRAGIEYITELDPEQSERMDRKAVGSGTWHQINETIKWGRLYGGCIAVALIDGQDMRTPLRIDTVGPRQYKGLLALDRWMVEPTLEDLVTDFGPNLGMPKYYRVNQAAPALRGAAVHHSRVMVRHVGVSLPYQQRLMENLWGLSVLERLYDRMIAFDSASTGAAQLVYKSYLRTLSVAGLRDIVAAGGAPLTGLTSYVDMMRRFQGIEGITVIDAEDKFEVQTSQAFSGLSDALVQFGQQLSGALQIPLVRLFGQSPAGLNSTGESDLRMYYDHINQLQMSDLHEGVTTIYKLIARSEGFELPHNFQLGFKSLWQLKDEEKANIAKTNADTVNAVLEAGVISPQTALKELRQSSRQTGVFTNVTRRMIDEADDQVAPPPAEEAMPGAPGAPPSAVPGMGEPTPTPEEKPGFPAAQEKVDGQAGPEGQASPMGQGTQRRARVQLRT